MCASHRRLSSVSFRVGRLDTRASLAEVRLVRKLDTMFEGMTLILILTSSVLENPHRQEGSWIQYTWRNSLAVVVVQRTESIRSKPMLNLLIGLGLCAGATGVCIGIYCLTLLF